MECRLVNNKNFFKELNLLVKSLIKDEDNPNNTYQEKLICVKWKNGIRKLKESYLINKDEFNEAVEKYLNDEFGIYEYSSKKDTFKYLKVIEDINLDDEDLNIEVDEESKTDSLSTTVEKAEKNTIKGLFLRKYFPLSSISKLFFLRKFKNEVIKAMFINDGLTIDSSEEMNESIRNYQLSLLNKIRNALSSIDPRAAAKFDEALRDSKTTAVNYAANYLENYNYVGLDLIQKIPIYDTLSSRNLVLLDGWQAWVIMTNFDPLMKLTFGRAVSIKYSGEYDVTEDKYTINKGDKNTTTWRDDNKDVDETEELGTIPVLFLESLRIYKDGYPTNLYLNFTDVKVALGNIMNLFNNTYNGNKVFRRDLYRFDLIEYLKPVYGQKLAEFYVDNFIIGKTLKQVIAYSKEHPNGLMPILFYLLTKEGIFKPGTKTRETIESIFHNIFDLNEDNSLFKMTCRKGFPTEKSSLYGLVATLFINVENRPFLEYTYDYESGITVKSLKEKTSRSRLNSLTRSLDSKYKKGNPVTLNSDGSTKFRTFDLIDHLDEEYKYIELKSGDFTVKIDSSLNVTVYKQENGKNIQLTDNNLEILLENLLPMFSEILEVPIVFEEEGVINNRIHAVFKTLGEKNINLAILAANVMYNYQVGKHLIGSTKSTYRKNVEKYYTGVAPKSMYDSFLPELVSGSVFTIMENLSKAKDIVEGYSEINSVKDGSGKLLSTLALSSLMSKVGEIWENHTKNEDSPSKDFSIFSLFEGFELIRDYAGQGESKQGREFSTAEFAIASFLYDMYSELEETSEDNFSEKKNGILRVMGPVVSDKSNLIKLKFNWDKVLPKKYWEGNNQLRLRDCSNEKIKEIIKEEFGQYYRRVFDNIVSQYNILNALREGGSYRDKAVKNLRRSSIVWAHPAIGKTESITRGKYKDLLIDWDEEFNKIRDKWIADHTGTERGSVEFNKVKNEYLIHPETDLEYIDFIKENWELVKQKAELENKILLASPLVLLQLFPDDFNLILNVDTNTFIERDLKRDKNTTFENSSNWKLHINTVLSLYKDQSKIVTTDKFIELILDGQFDYKTNFLDINLLAKLKNISVLDLLHEAIYLAQVDGKEIEIIDNVGYILKKGELKNNPSIIHLMNIFGVGEKDILTDMDVNESYELFWHRKEMLLITDFLLSGAIFKIKNGETLRKGNVCAVALKYNSEFIKGENIAVLKITDDEDYVTKITRTRDIKDWYPYERFIKEVGKDNPEFDVDNPAFNLESTLTAISERSLLWKLLEKENLNKLIKLIKIDNRTSKEKLLELAREEYYIMMLLLNPTIAENEERFNESWERKILKDFIVDEKLNKSNIIEYIKKRKIRRILEDKYDLHQSNFELDSEIELFIIDNNITKKSFNILINPEVIKHNLLDFFLSEEFVLSTTGTYVSHPAKNETDIRIREAELFGQAIKRYVSYTASKHRELAGTLDGIPSKIKFAIIEDYRDEVFNFNGNYDKRGTKPFDGASFGSITMNYLDNNSLGGDAMGVDKKPFGHALGVKSGIGTIWKTALFSLTNDRIRGSEFYKRLNKQMLNLTWSLLLDWTKDFNGNSIEYGEWFVYDPLTKNWYKYSNPTVDNEGNTYIDYERVTDTGETINNTLKKHVNCGKINTNWKLWKLFGGEYSGHLGESGYLQYEQDNSSVELLVKAMNNVGIKKYDNPIDLLGVDLVLKNAQIHIVATEGAVKYGGANINSQEAYWNDDYHLTYTILDTYDIGTQLDAEHNAEDESVALMTQVVNALGARGYSREQAQECYEVLAIIAETLNKDGLEGLLVLNDTGDPSVLKDALAIIIYKTLSKVSDTDGNMLNALASTLLELGNTKFDWSNLQGKFPISHPAIFAKIISSISSELEKAIRLKFEGGMYVLNPSNRIFPIINGHPAGWYDTHKEELIELENKNKSNPISSFSEIRIGYNYRTIDPLTGEIGEVWYIDNPGDLYELQEYLNSGGQVYETVIDDNDNALGHDLAMYNVIFYDQNGNAHNIWELDTIKLLWLLENYTNEEAERRKILLRRRLQQDLGAISEGVGNLVYIDGHAIKVDKSKTKTFGYEAILPMIYKTEFGLKEGDNLNKIKEDLKFFIRRSLDNWESKINNKRLYDLELKTIDGNHVYLGTIPEENSLSLDKVNLHTYFDGDVLYRITPEGKKLYSIPYHFDENGRIVEDVEVFKDIVSGREIIYSNNLTHFLDEFHYNEIVFSPECKDYKTVLRQLNDSTNRTAIRKSRYIINTINTTFQNSTEDISDIFLAILGTSLKNNEELIDVFDEDSNLTMDDILADSDFLEQAHTIIKNDYYYYNDNLSKLYEDLDREDILTLKNKYKPFKNLILSGIEIHTSFLSSLEVIVSRTPALSQQSFMAMDIVAFAPESTNSAYVSRWLLWLQGSDYDIDKISLLGLKFRQGKLITWSPYFNMDTLETFEASKKLPFPNGNKLELIDVSQAEGKPRPFDVMLNNLIYSKMDNGLTSIISENGIVLITYNDEEGLHLSCNLWDKATPLEKYSLLRRAILNESGKKLVFDDFSIGLSTKVALGIDSNWIATGKYSLVEDLEEFNDAIYPIDNIKITPKKIQLDIISKAPALGTLIKVYNKLGYVLVDETASEEENMKSIIIKNIVDYHNTSLKGRGRLDAAYNFISIKTKDISKSPINLIQAQAAIDKQTDNIKDLFTAKDENGKLKYPNLLKLLSATTRTDRGSVYSKIYMLTLTLAGKENVGIVASSLKNFEAISQHTYQVLDEGSKEELEDLIFDRTINGHRIRMIANSYTRNLDNIKSEKVKDVLKTVDNDTDAFLVKSALLSLATDNAKDPILPKLNSGQEMMGLFDSGVILGLSVKEVADLTLSKTGILLSRIMKSNVFNGYSGFRRLTSAILYLNRPPSVYFTEAEYASLSPLFIRLGLLKLNTVLNKTLLDNLLNNKNARATLRQIFKFLIHPNLESSLLEFNEEEFIKNHINFLKGTKEYRGFTKNRKELLESLLLKLENGEVLTDEELKTVEKLLKYLNDEEAVKLQINELIGYLNGETPTDTEVVNFISLLKEISSDDFKDNLSTLRSNLYGEVSAYSSNLDQLIDWIDYRDIIENDLIEGYDGANHYALNQIAKLDEFSNELSALRNLTKLNLGLPNKIEDLFKFINDFGNIITDRLNTIGSKVLEKYYDVNDELAKLKLKNLELRDSGLISSMDDYYIDLNSFLYDKEYNLLVKDIYGKIKFAVNILAVIDGVAHYRSYLRQANLAISMGKTGSVAYRTALDINDRIIPKMNTKATKTVEQIRKNIFPTIYRRINLEFLLSQNIEIIIPLFEIKDGKVEIIEGHFQKIILGNKGDNLKFKDWMDYIEFPRLQEKYPDNKFILYLGYRSYDYNVDHNLTTNIGKIKLANAKNASDMVLFNLAKDALLLLPAKVINNFFYYNIIAYNNLAGQLSLTDLFEDLISANKFSSIRSYNEFWANYEDKKLQFESDEELQIAIAPVLSIYDLKQSLKIPFIYVLNKEDGKTYLLRKIKNNNDDIPEEFEDYFGGEDEDSSGRIDFFGIIRKANYVKYGNVGETTPISDESVWLDLPSGIKMTNAEKINDIMVEYNGSEYTAKDILKISKNKGFASKLSEIFTYKEQNGERIYDTEEISEKLDTILNDDNSCRI